MDIFEQRFLFSKTKIEYQESGILYSFGNVISNKQYFIEYENILLNNITRETKTDKFNLFVCLISLTAVLKSILGVYDNPNGIYKGLLPFSFLFFIVFLAVTIIGRTNFLFIETVNGLPIKLFNNKSNKSALDQFLKKFKQKIKAYLKTKYTEIDKDVAKETQLENLFWLKNNKIISKQEYESLKAGLINEPSEVKNFTE